ncbi:alpha/beta hydrolase [Arthrobacter sp. Sa2CUA1]|uniref:Alpha/beta hydrolase n=1 Tax=Arthrobacter gallicola TaxID=2762225 RepID=A0ABR8UR72_9MICC|nr:alpha/beta hydrolase [Arthrobacter gallicola]MBD7994591.1 alpha/beta hydrolase [Arthrobacter gallicola]
MNPQQALNSTPPRVLLLPGAWMGSWIWEPTAESLRSRGLDAQEVTLAGLEPETPAEERAAIRLADHVDQVCDLVEHGAPVVLVAHSYSGMVAAQVADRLGDQIRSSIHFQSFLPVDGCSLVDLWGPDGDARAQERADIIADGYLWAAPPAAALDAEAGLGPEERSYLAERFTPHPGRTVLDKASLEQPVRSQRGVFVTPARTQLPEALGGAADWRIEILPGGHWPMLEHPGEVTELIGDHTAAVDSLL